MNMSEVVEEARRIVGGLRIKAERREGMSSKRKNEVNPGFRKKIKIEWCSFCKANHQGQCSAGTRRCDNCGRTGHAIVDCKDEARCYRCGETDHWIAKCPRRKGEKGNNNPLKVKACVYPEIAEKVYDKDIPWCLNNF